MISNLSIAFLNAVVWGMIMALIALGLNMIFGLLHIINMAHGALYMLGAVVAWYLIELTGNFWIALVIAPFVLGLSASLMERGLLQDALKINPSRRLSVLLGSCWPFNNWC